MPLIDDVIEYAKGNAAAAKSLDEQQTWAAHHRSLVEIRRQYEQQINDCLAAFTGRHESDAKVIAALRGALEQIGWMDEFLDADGAKTMMNIARNAINAIEQTVGENK